MMPMLHTEVHRESISQPLSAEGLSVLGVDYLRLSTADSGDLFLTPFGVQFPEQLSPENWYEPAWFNAHRQRLGGTSAAYRVPTKPVRGTSLDLVVRFNRVGEMVPIDTQTMCEYPHTEFNGPFEEFSLVMALRAMRSEVSPARIHVKKPLAIFSPGDWLQLWQTGRRELVFTGKQARHPGVKMDIHRRYILLYCWIKGMDAVQAAEALGLTGGERNSFLAGLTLRAIRDLNRRGFRMIDIKPHHIIVRVRSDGSLFRGPDGRPAYALVDYELLERFRE